MALNERPIGMTQEEELLYYIYQAVLQLQSGSGNSYTKTEVDSLLNLKQNSLPSNTGATRYLSSDISGNLSWSNLNITNVQSGTLAARPAATPANEGWVYVTAGEALPINNGNSFISDGASWLSLDGPNDLLYLKLDGTNGPIKGNIDWGNYRITNISKLSNNGSGAGAGWNFDVNFTLTSGVFEAINNALSKRSSLEVSTASTSITRSGSISQITSTEWQDTLIKHSVFSGVNHLTISHTLTGYKVTRDSNVNGFNNIFPVTTTNIDITWRDKGTTSEQVAYMSDIAAAAGFLKTDGTSVMTGNIRTGGNAIQFKPIGDANFINNYISNNPSGGLWIKGQGASPTDNALEWVSQGQFALRINDGQRAFILHDSNYFSLPMGAPPVNSVFTVTNYDSLNGSEWKTLKTVGGQSIFGSGDIPVTGGGSTVPSVTLNLFGATVVSGTPPTGNAWSANTNYVYEINMPGIQIGDVVKSGTNAVIWEVALAQSVLYSIDSWVHSTGTVRFLIRVSSYLQIPSSNAIVKIAKVG